MPAGVNADGSIVRRKEEEDQARQSDGCGGKTAPEGAAATPEYELIISPADGEALMLSRFGWALHGLAAGEPIVTETAPSIPDDDKPGK